MVIGIGIGIERRNGHSNGRVKLEGDGANDGGLVVTDKMPPFSSWREVLTGRKPIDIKVVRVEQVIPPGYVPQEAALGLVVTGKYRLGLAEILQRPTSENYGLVSQRNALAEVIRKLTALDEAIMNNRPKSPRESVLFDGAKVARTEFIR